MNDKIKDVLSFILFSIFIMVLGYIIFTILNINFIGGINYDFS